MTELAVIARAEQFRSSIALRTPTAQVTYGALLDRSAATAAALLGGSLDLQEARIAVLVPAGADYVSAQWGVWRAGGVQLPLSLSAAEPEWEYALVDSGASHILATATTAEQIRPLCDRLGRRLLVLEEISPALAQPLPSIDAQRRGMMLYTSGSTSKPKGVITTHGQIVAQITSLVEAWEWSAADSIPLFLPLHHIHGVINVLGCGLWSGATIEPFARFETAAVLERLRAGAYTLFMAVPTIYVKLLEWLRAALPEEAAQACAAFGRLRLMVSGSAALPASIHEEWFRWTGQKLLERYGMTEIGMALSNPLHGERRPGAVGQPLPGVEVRLLAENGELISEENLPGEIQVRGGGVFGEYWNRPQITVESFTDGWFRTGDMGVIEAGYYRILGRLSVDIIKSGGYKLSALEIEAVLLEHPAIAECAVVGVPDATWGEEVAAVVVLKPEAMLDLPALRDWCRERMSAYKIPKRLLAVASLPRNALGKVTKPAVQALAGSISAL